MAKVSKSEFARRAGCSRPYISKLLKEGRLQADEHGRIDFELGMRSLRRNRDPARDHLRRTGLGNGSAGAAAAESVPAEEAATAAAGDDRVAGSYLQARAIREHYKARQEKQRFEERAGVLVHVDKVKSTAFSLSRTLRDALLALPDRLAPIIAAEQDPRLVHELLSSEIRMILEQLTEQAKRYGVPAPNADR